MNTDLTLYESKASPNSLPGSAFSCRERHSTFPLSQCRGPWSEEQFSDAYAVINPRKQVPTLVLRDGTAIGEVPAIWRTSVEDAYPGKAALLGTHTSSEGALITMWERRAELDGFAAVMEGVRNAVAGLKGRALSGPHAYEQIPELLSERAARSELLRRLQRASENGSLRGRQRVLGGRHHDARDHRLCDGWHEEGIPAGFDALQTWNESTLGPPFFEGIKGSGVDVFKSDVAMPGFRRFVVGFKESSNPLDSEGIH